MGFSFKNVSNSGTSWKRYRSAKKLPSTAHDGRGTVSFSRPHKMMPWATVSCPGKGLVLKSLTAGCEIPSKNPKLDAVAQHIGHMLVRKQTHCSCACSFSGRTLPLSVSTS